MTTMAFPKPSPESDLPETKFRPEAQASKMLDGEKAIPIGVFSLTLLPPLK